MFQPVNTYQANSPHFAEGDNESSISSSDEGTIVPESTRIARNLERFFSGGKNAHLRVLKYKASRPWEAVQSNLTF